MNFTEKINNNLIKIHCITKVFNELTHSILLRPMHNVVSFLGHIFHPADICYVAVFVVTLYFESPSKKKILFFCLANY